MSQLCIKVVTTNVNDKEDAQFVAKFPDPQSSNQYITLKYKHDAEEANEDKSNEDKDNEDNDNQWTVDIDDSVLKLLTNIQTIEIFDTVANKDGSTTETKIGTATMDLSHFLYGDTEIESNNMIQSIESKDEIGSINIAAAITNPLFNDGEIDLINYLNVEIGKMENIPPTWAEQLSSSAASNNKNTKDKKKKSKGKQQIIPKHWLCLEWQIFDQITSLKTNISHYEAPQQIESENEENDENKESKYYLNWEYHSKCLLKPEDMKLLLNENKSRTMIKITHQYEEINENQEIEIAQDPNYIEGEIDVQSLFNISESMLAFNANLKLITSEDAEDSIVSNLDIKLSFDKSIKQYQEELDKIVTFEDLMCSENDKDKADIDDKKDDDEKIIDTKKCIEDIINLLADHYLQFKDKTRIQNYDKERMRQGFIYYLNSSGLYHELKEKLVKPQLLGYLKKRTNENKTKNDHPLNLMFENVLNDMIQNLSKQTRPTLETLPSEKKNPEEDERNIKLSITKHTRIAKDLERKGIISDAFDHYQEAYDQGKSLDVTVHWETLENLVHSLIQQNETKEVLSLLTKFVSNHPNHYQSLLYLTIVLIENKHENAKCVLYKLCDTQLDVLSLMLKSAFFSMNNDELRGTINFKKAVKLSADIQHPFDTLFQLQLFNIISKLLNEFEKSNQIDINYHANNAKLYLGMKRYGTALSSINEAIRIDDENDDVSELYRIKGAGLYAIKGHIEYESDKIDDAMQSYIQHLQFLPGTAESLLPPKPEVDTKELVDKLAIYRLGKMYETQCEWKLCKQTFIQGIEYEPESWIFWWEAGNVLFQLKEYAECIHCFLEANMIHNKESHSWCMLGLAFLATNEPQKAIKMMKETVKFGMDNITNDDKQRIKQFGTDLIKLGHVGSGKFFKNSIA